MNTTSAFHEAKMNLESALVEFIKAAQADDRDVVDEINEALVDACNETGIKDLIVEEE